jgi:hypothetical protein
METIVARQVTKRLTDFELSPLSRWFDLQRLKLASAMSREMIPEKDVVQAGYAYHKQRELELNVYRGDLLDNPEDFGALKHRVAGALEARHAKLAQLCTARQAELDLS